MLTLSQLTELLGWASVINIAYLLLATFVLMLFQEKVISIHSRMFGLDDELLRLKYFEFLSHYKIITLVFCASALYCFKNNDLIIVLR